MPPIANLLRWRTFLADRIEMLEHRGQKPYADTTMLTGTIAAVFDRDPEWYWMVLRTAIVLLGAANRTEAVAIALRRRLI